MSFIGGSLPKIKEDEDEDSWKPGQVGTLGTELNKNINKWISENTWERIPEQYREAIKIGVALGAYSGSHFADGTPKPIKSEWLMNLHPAVLKYKGIRSVLSRGFNINPGLVDKGAIVGGTGKTLYNKLNQSTAAHQAVHQAGQNVRRNVDRIKTDVDWAKKQINTLAGNEPNILTKKPNQYINVENVFNDTSKVNTKIRNILANNPGMSYTTARETALLQLKGTHPTGLLKPGHNRSVGAAASDSSLSPSTGHGDVENRLPNIKKLSDKLKIQAANILTRESTNPNLPQATRMILATAHRGTGYTPGGWFYYTKFRENASNMKEQGRSFLGPYQAGTTLSGAPRYVDFNQYRGPELDRLRQEFSPAIQAMGLSPESFNVHHIAALKAVMGIWDGLQMDSPLYKEVSGVLQKYVPGLGDNPSNLLGVVGKASDVGTPHHLVHRFYAKKTGEAGELFFTPEVLYAMKRSKTFRLKKTRELGLIIAESERIVRNAQTVYKELYGQTRTLPEDLVEALQTIPVDNKYTVPVLKDIIKQIMVDYDKSSQLGFQDALKAAETIGELDDYSSSVRQVIQDTDPSELPKKKRVISKKKKVDKKLKSDEGEVDDTYQSPLDPNDPSNYQ